MHDRLLAVGVFVVLGICCIGAYVAVSGFWLVSPNGPDLRFLSAVQTPMAFSQGSVAFPTETLPGPTFTPRPSSTRTITPSPTITPKGFRPSATPAQPPTETPLPQITFVVTQFPTAAGTSVPPQSQSQPPPPAAPPAQSGCQGYDYCPQLGPADPVLGPTGKACPVEYLWGRVVDQNGAGVTNVKVRYTDPAGNSGAPFVKDRAPDLPGAWNIPTSGPSGTWTLQLVTADDRALSPKHTIAAGQPNAAGGLCGTRVDFKKVR